MKFQGESFFQAPRDQVWAAIVDPRPLLAKLSGFQRFDPIGDHEYEGAFEISIGEVRGDFQGTLELADLKPPSSLRFSLNAMGAAGFIDGDGMMVLEEAGDGTRIHYDLDAKIGGRIAAVGEGALKESAGALARRALEGLGRRSSPPAPGPKFKIFTRQEASPPVEPAREEVPPPEPAAVAAIASPVKASGEPGEEGEKEPAAASELSGTNPAFEVSPETAETPVAAAETNGSVLFRQGQYGSRVSRNSTNRFLAIFRRPEALGVALVLYTILVVLITRSCS